MRCYGPVASVAFPSRSLRAQFSLRASQKTTLAVVVAALSFNLPATPLSRRDVFATVAGAAAFGTPLAASAYNQADRAKAMAIYGQRVLALEGASASGILDEAAAIKIFASQMGRAAGKRNVDGRRLGGFPLADAANSAIAAAGAGDTAGAQAGIKEMVKIAGITKIPPYGSDANPFAGGVSFTSMSGTTGTPGSW